MDEYEKPSYFQFLTCMMFYVFSEEAVDVAVVEVGIGGEVDFTNIVRILLLFSTISKQLYTAPHPPPFRGGEEFCHYMMREGFDLICQYRSVKSLNPLTEGELNQ